VFISITTIPAAADIGVSLAFSSWAEARGSTLQLLLNVVLLIVVGAFALRVQRRLWRNWTARPARRSGGVSGVSSADQASGGQNGRLSRHESDHLGAADAGQLRRPSVMLSRFGLVA
jgi:Domain of unknown function (DUF389)